MARTYRTYFLNDAGHIVDAVTLECDTDEEAASVAESHARKRPWELWNLERCVRTHEDARKPAP
jgi:hypothetical protein